MDLIYSMRRKSLKCEPPQFESITDPEIIRPIVTISICNIIAFSSPTELDDVEGDTWGGHVYVCDLDTPWDSHKVTSTDDPVTALEWDGEGKQLLVATSTGSVSVYGMKDYLLNAWTCLNSAEFPGEHILKGIFFHNGRRFVVTDKKPDAPLTERIQMLRPAPTMKGFGGVAVEASVVVTASGAVSALWEDGRTDTVRAHAGRVLAADMAHKNGNILVACLCAGAGGGAPLVRCYVWGARGALQPLPAIPLSALPPATLCVSWCVRDNPDCLLVAGAGVSMWKISERQHPVHKLFAKGPLQGSTTPGGGQKPGSDCFNTVGWQQVSSWADGTEPAQHAACGKLSAAAPRLLLASATTLRTLPVDDYGSSRVLMTLTDSAGGGSPPKKLKYHNGVAKGSPVLCCVDVSALGGVAVAVDSRAQLHVCQLPQAWTDLPGGGGLREAQWLLEYALVASLDVLDLLLTMRHPEPLYDRITENFQRQSAAFQQYYHNGWMKMRMALCRINPSAQTTLSFLSSLVSAAAAWAAAAAVLRPDDRPECAPLAALTDDSQDLDKTLSALESKPELLDAVALQPLRRPLQRAAHLASTLIAAVPHHHHPELLSEPGAIALLRRLLWAGGRGTGEPARLLPRMLVAHARPELVEECLCVSAGGGGRAWEAPARAGVSAPHGQPLPLICEYGVEPEALRHWPEPPPYALTDTAPLTQMDAIRYTYLGGRAPARCCGCARCGARALPPPAPPGPTTSAPASPAAARDYLPHHARFFTTCRCGGKWTLFSNVA